MIHPFDVLPILASSWNSERDTSGVFGGIYHYALVFAFFGTALVSFIYFWKKGRLDMDEEPKIKMFYADSAEDSHESK